MAVFFGWLDSSRDFVWARRKWYVTGLVVSLELARITGALGRFIFSPPLVSSVSRFARNTAFASLGSIAG